MSNTVVTSAFHFPWREVLTPIVGLVGAFGGAFLANYFAEKRWQKQVEHEAKKDSIKVIRDKGEELYTLFCRWEKLLFSVQMAQVRYIKSQRMWDGFEDHITSISLEPGVYDRLQALLNIYFYELAPRLGKVQKEMEKCNEAFENFHKGLIGNVYESSDIILKSTKDLEEHVLIMKEHIRTKLKI